MSIWGYIVSSVVIGGFTYMMVKFPQYASSRDRLRWQRKTQKNAQKALAKDAITPSAAFEIMTHPGYGIQREEVAGFDVPTDDDEIWQGRGIAFGGWNAAAFVSVAFWVFFTVVGLLTLLFVSMYAIIGMLDAAWVELMWGIFLGVSFIGAVVFFGRFTWRVLKTTLKMMKYK